MFQDVLCGVFQFKPRVFTPSARRKSLILNARYFVGLRVSSIVRDFVYARFWHPLPRFELVAYIRHNANDGSTETDLISVDQIVDTTN